MKSNLNDFVTIFFEGLMISCFNPNKRRFETVLVRRSNHDFTVRIVKYKGDNIIEDVTHENIPNQNVIFDFEGKGNPEVSGYRLYQSGTFNRVDEPMNDSRDLRWLVDLEGKEFYDSKVEPTGLSLSKYKMPLIPVYIKNAEFFTNQITPYTTEKVLDDEKGNEISREFFGKCGCVMCARINADSVIMNFEGTKIPSSEINRSEGFTYNIFITNTREGGDEESELPVYYRVIKHSSGNQYNLDFSNENEVQLYTRMGNCTKILLSKTESLDDFS